ncbi:MAG: hypothetical protein C4293_05575 [Nitrospiraceae bacterium]
MGPFEDAIVRANRKASLQPGVRTSLAETKPDVPAEERSYGREPRGGRAIITRDHVNNHLKLGRPMRHKKFRSSRIGEPKWK